MIIYVISDEYVMIIYVDEYAMSIYVIIDEHVMMIYDIIDEYDLATGFPAVVPCAVCFLCAWDRDVRPALLLQSDARLRIVPKAV